MENERSLTRKAALEHIRPPFTFITLAACINQTSQARKRERNSHKHRDNSRLSPFCSSPSSPSISSKYLPNANTQ